MSPTERPSDDFIPSGVMEHVVDAGDVIRRVNENWLNFAAENWDERLARSVVGSTLWNHIAGTQVADIYRELLSRLRQHRQPISFGYRCDSPGVVRVFRMTMLAGPDDEVAFRTVVVSTEPRNSPANILDPAVPHSPRARIKMCAWCKAVFDGNHWLDLDQAVERLDLLLQDELPSIYYGMCETCFAEICGTEVP